MLYLFIFLLFTNYASGILWKNGIVHYTINQKHYDVHSQDIIVSTFSQIQNEVCVKFFQAPLNYNSSTEKILYVNNPDKIKSCPSVSYDFSKNVIDMPIGYKCINQREIARIIVDMLKASINPAGSSVNSYDLIKKFNENESEVPNQSLISSSNRNYINAHYQIECGLMSQPLQVMRRSDNDSETVQLSVENIKYYSDKLWPLGIVLYGIDNDLKSSEYYKELKRAMSAIEIHTCVVFQEYIPDDILVAKSFLWFGNEGEDMPLFGFSAGRQPLKLTSFLQGAPGHKAHAVNNLLRVLGIHMMSNRYDRDNHVIINWRNVEKGKEQYLEKAPESAWLQQIAYDFDSVSHAPANYMCGDCDLGATTVQPIQDRLWQRTLSMGHRTDLNKHDVRAISLLYNQQCRGRYTTQ